MPERNKALFHRYFFHAEVNRYRYDVCLEELEKEFFLTSFTIVKIMTAHMNELDRIIEKNPSIADMKKEFPWFNWKARA